MIAPESELAPHVFVTMGDLTHLQCDAWMLPVGSGYHVRDYWLDAGEGLQAAVYAMQSPGFNDGSVRAQVVDRWPTDKPTPVMTSVTGIVAGGPRGLEALRQSVDEFVDVAARHIRSHPAPAPRNRALPLIALPLIGTQGGGATMHRGAIVETILDAATLAGHRNGVDVVLVLNDSKSFALAQSNRRKSAQWPGVSDNQTLMERVLALADKAITGRLVPFMGAGVSMSAGAPSWKELISRLAAKVDLTAEELASLTNNNRSALDQAAFLRHAFYAKRSTTHVSELDLDNNDETDGGFAEAIVEAVLLPRYGLAPALLASFGSKQAITLNYDDLYERAYRDVGGDLTVIPGRTAESTDNWLLKLHGSVDQPESIVLTRDDYLGFSANREALSAIVKANLITHHIMFVGFGLVDDHFHQIIHDVRRAMPADRRNSTEFATALVLREDPLDSALWQGQLNLVTVGEPGSNELRSARSLEIFLDALLAHSVDSHSYLLDEKFAGGLSEVDKVLRNRILQLASEITREEKASSSAWPVVAKMLRELGAE